MSISPGAWEAAQVAYERSVVLMGDCRRMIAEQRAMIEALRSRMAGGPVLAERAADPRAPDGGALLLDLEQPAVIGTLTLLPVRRQIDGPRCMVSLTPSEWQLLIVLLGQRTAVLNRAELAARHGVPGTPAVMARWRSTSAGSGASWSGPARRHGSRRSAVAAISSSRETEAGARPLPAVGTLLT